jgi:hypothetical protein
MGIEMWDPTNITSYPYIAQAYEQAAENPSIGNYAKAGLVSTMVLPVVGKVFKGAGKVFNKAPNPPKRVVIGAGIGGIAGYNIDPGLEESNSIPNDNNRNESNWRDLLFPHIELPKSRAFNAISGAVIGAASSLPYHLIADR